MNEEDSAPPADSPEQSIWDAPYFRWPVVFVILNVFVALLLAGRAASAPDKRVWFELVLGCFWPAIAGAWLLRRVSSYPIRFPELLLTVIIIAASFAAVLHGSPDSALSAKFSGWMTCVVFGDIFLGGLYIGLRHCALLRIDGSMPRVGVVLLGLLFFPAVFIVPGILLVLVLAAGDFRRLSDASLTVAVLVWLLSAAIISCNVVLALKTAQLKK